MTRHPWVAKADDGIRFAVQLAPVHNRLKDEDFLDADPLDDPMSVIQETARLAERLGFDGLFIFDHPLIAADPWLALAGVAMVTERVMLGSVVLGAPYRHPTMLARLATDLDHLSRGRLLLGLGIGWAEREFRAFGVAYERVPQRQAALAEVVEIITGLWSGEPFSWSGEHFQLDSVRIGPKPLQQPAPPIMIGGGGMKVTLRQVARYADACNIDEQDVPPEQRHADADAGFAILRDRLDALERHCEQAGRPHDEILRSHFGWFLLAPTDAAVHAKLQRIGATTFADGGAVFAGTPSRMVEHFQRLADLGLHYFVVNLCDAADHETLHLLANEVMPHIH